MTAITKFIIRPIYFRGFHIQMIYKHYCQKCKEEKPHRILLIRRSKGAKLSCLACGKNTSRYYNINELEEINFKDIK